MPNAKKKYDKEGYQSRKEQSLLQTIQTISSEIQEEAWEEFQLISSEVKRAYSRPIPENMTHQVVSERPLE